MLGLFTTNVGNSFNFVGKFVNSSHGIKKKIVFRVPHCADVKLHLRVRSVIDYILKLVNNKVVGKTI